MRLQFSEVKIKVFDSGNPVLSVELPDGERRAQFVMPPACKKRNSEPYGQKNFPLGYRDRGLQKKAVFSTKSENPTAR